MTIKLIKTNKDYQNALLQIGKIFYAKPGSAEGDELKAPGILIDKYEKNHYPIEIPDPIEATKFRMEQRAIGSNKL